MEKRTSSGCPLFVFCGVSQWVSGGGKQKIQGGWSCYAARQACETQEKAYCRIWRYKTARYFPPGMPQESLRSGNRHGSMTNCLFSGQGLEVPPRQTATETFHADQRDVFSGVGESLRGGGDSFYKKRPRLPPANQTCPHLQTCTESLLPAIPARRPACEETKKERDVPPLSGLQSLPPSGDGRDLTTKKRFTAPQGSGPARPVR